MASEFGHLRTTTLEEPLPRGPPYVPQLDRPGFGCPNCREGPRPPRQSVPPFWTYAVFGFMAFLTVALVLVTLQWATGGDDADAASRRSARVLVDKDDDNDNGGDGGPRQGEPEVPASGCPDCPAKCRASESSGSLICVPKCADTEFTCESDRCVDVRGRCDGAADCDDMSDETGCPCDEDVAFRCGLNTSCLPLRRRCDGVADCWDMTDEVDCPRDECPPSTVDGKKGYLCHGWHCVPPQLVCDGREDCEDGGDEGACPKSAD
ncbi:unnamed protein product [Ixodes hexagonus]